jgi:putative transposase
METHLHGTSACEVDDPVRPLARTAASPGPKCPGSALTLDTEVAAFRDRSLASMAFPYVFLDAPHREPG